MSVPQSLDRSEADAIVAEAARTYFDGCRDRIDAFVDRNFSHRRLGPPARPRRRLGSAEGPGQRRPLDPADRPEARRRRRPPPRRAQDRRGARQPQPLPRHRRRPRAALAADDRPAAPARRRRRPRLDHRRPRRDDPRPPARPGDPRRGRRRRRRSRPAFRARLEVGAHRVHRHPRRRRRDHHRPDRPRHRRRRLQAGDPRRHRPRPGPRRLDRARARRSSSFPLGATAGGIWYGLFPVQASPFLVAGATAGVLGVAAIATAFAGIVSDPVQRALGLHHRRLAALHRRPRARLHRKATPAASSPTTSTSPG